MVSFRYRTLAAKSQLGGPSRSERPPRPIFGAPHETADTRHLNLPRRILYSRWGNTLLRTALKPFAGWMPDGLKFPVVGRIRVRFPEGKELSIVSNPTCYAAKQLYWEGYQGFEARQLPLFIDLVRGSTVFLDVGANVGYYSLLAATYNEAIEVQAFEPLPAAFQSLQLNCRVNHLENVKTNRLALSDTNGETTFYAARNPKFDFVDQQLTATGSLNREQANRTTLLDEIPVTTMRLDDFVREKQVPRVDLIKLDTEATEHLVLDGAREVITKFKPVILCEVLPGRVEEEIDRLISSMGYAKYAVASDGLVEVESLSHTAETTNDHVFCHRSELHRIEKHLARAAT